MGRKRAEEDGIISCLFLCKNEFNDGEDNVLALNKGAAWKPREPRDSYVDITFLFIFGIARKLETFRKVQVHKKLSSSAWPSPQFPTRFSLEEPRL